MGDNNQQDAENLIRLTPIQRRLGWQPLDWADEVMVAHVRSEWLRTVRKMHKGAVVDPAFVKNFAVWCDEVGAPPRWDAQIKRIDRKGDFVCGNLRWALPREKWRKPYKRRTPAGA